jgi:hypothetical protein
MSKIIESESADLSKMENIRESIVNRCMEHLAPQRFCLYPIRIFVNLQIILNAKILMLK